MASLPPGRSRTILFLAAAAVAAALFTRLGVWQLHRLSERRARNALIATRLASSPAPLATLSRQGADARYRRVHLSGTYDFAHEYVIVNRIHEGSPGVHIITPVRPDNGFGADTSVLVDRGWVYAPDGATVDLTDWREPAHLAGTGYVREFLEVGPGAAEVRGRPYHLRWLDPAVVSRSAPNPLVPYYVVLDPLPGERSRHVPAREPVPTLDDGPHLSYAIQWFSFAAMAIVAAVLALRTRPRRRAAPN